MSASSSIEIIDTPVVVLGAGVAGLSAALTLGEGTIVADSRPGIGGSTPWAQGGVAAAVGVGDSPAAHAVDTVAAGGGLVDEAVAGAVTGAAPDAIAWLTSLGARFDRDDDGQFTLGREAAHGAHRIVHAKDATGAELARTLADAVAAQPAIRVVDATAVDLLRSGERVVGVLARRPDGNLVALRSRAVVLATGGYAHLWSATTTPPQAVGDGIAIAARAGAQLIDLEFVQFHPTALADAGDPLPLLTEALRGEGAVLVNETGERFCFRHHPDGELAPRDVVARAIYAELAAGRTPMLDARQAVGDEFPHKFPTVFALARKAGVDPRNEPVPVTPAAHYCMGGVAVDGRGRTSVDGLWAAGEVASTGLHGANRLASNSLLEGVVTGRRVAGDIAEVARAKALDHHRGEPVALEMPADALGAAEGDPSATVAKVRALLWAKAGLCRDAEGLIQALDTLAKLQDAALGSRPARNAVLIAHLVVSAALLRTESRGAHFRSDYPAADEAWATRRTQRSPAVATVPLPGAAAYLPRVPQEVGV